MKDLVNQSVAGDIYDRARLTSVIEGSSDAGRAVLTPWIEAMMSAEIRTQGQPDTKDVVLSAFRACLDEVGLKQGRIAEIGGPFNSPSNAFSEFEFEWLSLYPVPGREEVKVCDICDVDHIGDRRYDAIFSVSVMEHVSEPWRAAQNMQRLLKPGGIIFHAAPFAYFYHGAPDDYWRYTPDAFGALFPTLKPLRGEFYGGARRRDNRGSHVNPVDKDGGPAFAPDAFGGWRENWTTIYCGQKCSDWADQKRRATVDQIVVDLMRHYVVRGLKAHQAAHRVSHGLRKLALTANLRLKPTNRRRGLYVKPSRCVSLFRERDALGLRVSSQSHVRFAKFEHLLDQLAQRPHPLRTFCSKLVSKALR